MVVGAMAAGVAAALAVLAARGGSTVERRLRLIGAATSSRTRFAAFVADPLAAGKIAGALTGALAGCAAAAMWSLGPLAAIVPAYAGWVAPAIVAARRAARQRRDADRAVVTLVEWLHALVASGRPLESALDSRHHFAL